mgnify:CR=1 FL=1
MRHGLVGGGEDWEWSSARWFAGLRTGKIEMDSQVLTEFQCVAGQKLFVADTAPEVVATARKTHPDDDGLLLRYIPRERMERVYAHSGALVAG